MFFGTDEFFQFFGLPFFTKQYDGRMSNAASWEVLSFRYSRPFLKNFEMLQNQANEIFCKKIVCVKKKKIFEKTPLQLPFNLTNLGPYLKIHVTINYLHINLW